MTKAEESVESEWMAVIENVQLRIVKKHNLSCKGAKVTVHDVRLAALRHPEIAFWVKHNRARVGTLEVGDEAPDVPLFRIRDASATTLFASFGSLGSSKPCVIMAGSFS